MLGGVHLTVTFLTEISTVRSFGAPGAVCLFCCLKKNGWERKVRMKMQNIPFYFYFN